MPTLADLQRLPGSEPSVPPPALPLDVERVTTFDTPEFAGMTFLEVEAKSALNRVRGMPFPWSINPYRGCSHACSYCSTGETPILLANGRTKPLADVRAGDAIYGTVVQGAYRRYVTTRVLDHWSVIKPAYRVGLEDGTELVTSGDHRFLTDRGWKHVTGTKCGRARRPHLTRNNKLMGTGGFAEGPKQDAEYQRGYLCGMIRGDGTIGSYRNGRGRQNHAFRLALVDDEGLRRTGQYLLDHGVPTREFLFQRATEQRKPPNAIRTGARTGVERIRDLIAWPSNPSDGWRKGFLAGIFDAEGSCSFGIMRICNSDRMIIHQITSCLRRFNFRHVMERQLDCEVVRLPGGLRERLRFFHLTDPAITRKRTFEGRALKGDAQLGVVAIEPLGLELPLYDITTGTGDFIADGVVSHNCFARPTHRYLNLSPLGDFERTVVVKTNVAEVLRGELRKRSWRGEHVAMGTNTDPYQRCEGRYRLMPGIIDALAESRTPFSVLTKGTLITRDLERLVTAAEQVDVACAFTVGMLDEAVWRSAEPGTPSPLARLQAVHRLAGAGIPTGVMLAPIMPGLNDDPEQLAALVERAAEAGAAHITPIVLHLRPGVREAFWPWLEAEHPGLVPRYLELYGPAGGRGGLANKAYRDRVEAFVRARRAEAWRRHGRPAVPPGWRSGGTADGDERSPVTADPTASRAAHGGAAGSPTQLTLLSAPAAAEGARDARE